MVHFGLVSTPHPPTKNPGYGLESLQYVRNQNQGVNKSKNRSRNIIWFNPPYSQNVQTNVAKSSLQLIDKHFPKSNKLHKVFNRNNLEVSYSYTTNTANIVKNHNQSWRNVAMMLKTNESAIAEIRISALLMVNALQATLSTKLQSGQLQVTRKFTLEWQRTISRQLRYNNHKLSFKDRKHSHDTVLSKHIWDLRDSNTSYEIKRRVIKKANAYKGNPSRGNLCLSEKPCILTARDVSLLNKKSELVTKCRHEKKVLHNQSEEASLQPSLNLKIENLKLTLARAEH